MSAFGRVVILFTVGLLVNSLCMPVCLGAPTYTGSLQYTPSLDAADGLYVAGGDWASKNFTFSWTVTGADSTHAGYPWKYEYRLQKAGDEHAFSHFILECSDALTLDDITGLAGATLSGDNPTDQRVQSGNPDMPEDVFGLRFDPPAGADVTDWTVTFYSDKAPVWGDFYAKNGGHNPVNVAYNRGFTDDDEDPTAAPADGTIGNHILRPDTTTTSVPVPAALLLAGIGTLVFGLAHRRRTL